MYAIYAFCREVDDIVDQPGHVANKKQALDAWRTEIGQLYAREPRWPTTRALKYAVQRFELPQEEFMAVIDGMETDAAQTLEMQTIGDLLTYCRRVAGAVGVLSIHVFGLPRIPGVLMAELLGNAFQLTNILRDLKEDADRQRLYVPARLLAKHDVAPRRFEDVFEQPGFVTACEELADLTRNFYVKADKLIRQLKWRQTRPVIMIRAVYRATFERLEKRGWDEWDSPVHLSRSRKFWLAVSRGLV